MVLAPICLFTYLRLSETQQTIEALKKNYLAAESELFIFSDGSKDTIGSIGVNKIRQYLKTIEGFKSVTIYESKENKGLAQSIIYGVTQTIEKYDKVIVLEDDLITAPDFLNFMNKALDFYKDEPKIQSISGYSLSLKDKSKEVYFQHRPGSWGWATWKNRWSPEIFVKEKLLEEISSKRSILKEFKKACGDDISKMLINSLIGKNDSWYVRWAFNHYVSKRYAVYPAYSFVDNIGFGVEGTHCKNINTYVSELVNKEHLKIKFSHFEQPQEEFTKEFLMYFRRNYKMKFRLRLMATSSGREQLIQELVNRIGITKYLNSISKNKHN